MIKKRKHLQKYNNRANVFIESYNITVNLNFSGKTNITRTRTKRTKDYQRQIINLKKMVTRMKNKEESFKTRLARAERVARSSVKLTSNMSKAARIFTGLQCRESGKSSRGRRFTEEEKVLSLSLLKRSPKSYNLLCKYFCLPSKKTLLNVLKAVKLVPGINKIIFEKLKDTVSKMNSEDRVCSLIFDEMSVTPHIYYDKSRDEIIGFENLGTYKTHKFADHVTVFMIKGLRKNFKQPVAYYFSQNMKSVDLKNIVINVIKNIQSTGLQVLVTVCDQSGINTATINSLILDAKRQYLRKEESFKNNIFIVGAMEIIPLYDVPHLLKGLRNNLLNKDLIFVDPTSKEEVTVKWEYFNMLYEADKCYGELRLMHKLTEEHVLAEKINKMRVKPAAQLFSHSVAVGIKHLSVRNEVPKDMEKIIPFIQMTDKLFDSLNGGTFHVKNGKIYTGAVKKNSPHHKLWEEAKGLFNSVVYVDRVSKIEKRVPTVKNWIKTIEGFKLLWKTLNEKYSQDCFLTRNCNQDPLENFFGNVRSMGARNVSPNCVGFEGAYKTLLLNNFSAHHSPRANCEEDINSCLQSLQFFITEKEKIQEETSKYENVHIGEPLELFRIGDTETPGIFQRNYVCGWALTKVLKAVKGCKKCKLSLCGSKNEPENDFIKLKEYNKNKTWLVYPSQNLTISFSQIQTVVSNFLTHDVHLPGLKERIKSLVEIVTDFSYHNCNEHREIFIKYFTEVSVNLLVYSWCKNVNRILSGKCNYNGEDQIKLAALSYFIKHKTKPKK